MIVISESGSVFPVEDVKFILADIRHKEAPLTGHQSITGINREANREIFLIYI